MPTRYQILLTLLAAALVAVFLFTAQTTPGLAGAANIEPGAGRAALQPPERLTSPALQSLQPTPSPALQSLQPTPSPAPAEALDERPVERNPFLVAGGILIFLVILFGVLRYSRPPESEG
jgi:hypothetical protein